MQRVQSGNSNTQCMHAFDPERKKNCSQFKIAFLESFDEASCRDTSLQICLIVARDATMGEFSEVWNDSAKMESVMRCLLFVGTQNILKGDDYNVQTAATFARYFEEHIAVVLKEIQALFRWPKIFETHYADLHSLVKFFRHRIPCSCLDEKYKEVKSITKTGFCCNLGCTIPREQLERSKTKYCSRCRCAVYCSRECQKSDWSRHKNDCNMNIAIMAEFEAEQQNM